MSFERGLAAEHIAIAKLIADGRQLAIPINPQSKYDLLLWDWQDFSVHDDANKESVKVKLQSWCRVQIKRAYIKRKKWVVDMRAWSGHNRGSRRLYMPDDLEFMCVVAGPDVLLIPWPAISDKLTVTITDKMAVYKVTGEVA